MTVSEQALPLVNCTASPKEDHQLLIEPTLTQLATVAQAWPAAQETSNGFSPWLRAQWSANTPFDRLTAAVATATAAGLAAISLRPEGAHWQLTALRWAAGPCIAQGRQACYRGSAAAVLDDDGHWLFGAVPVCEKTAARFARAPYADWVSVTSPADHGAGHELCGESADRMLTKVRAIFPKALTAGRVATTAVLYPGPFRCLVFADGSLLERGQVVLAAPSAAIDSALARGELLAWPVRRQAFTAPELSDAADTQMLPVRSIHEPLSWENLTESAAIPASPPLNWSAARRLLSTAPELRQQLIRLVEQAEPYLLLTGSDPDAQTGATGCCPSTVVAAANCLAEAGVLARLSRPLPPGACPVTVYTPRGELRGTVARPQFAPDAVFRARLLTELRPPWWRRVLRRILQTGLLGFVVLSLLVAVWTGLTELTAGTGRQIQNAGQSHSEDSLAMAVGADPLCNEALAVVVFHASQRCDFCRRLEMRSRAAAAAWNRSAAGRDQPLVVYTANYEAPEFDTVRQEFELFTATVVLVRLRNGRITDRRIFSDGWALSEDPAGFEAAFQRAAADLATAARATPGRQTGAAQP